LNALNLVFNIIYSNHKEINTKSKSVSGQQRVQLIYLTAIKTLVWHNNESMECMSDFKEYMGSKTKTNYENNNCLGNQRRMN